MRMYANYCGKMLDRTTWVVWEMGNCFNQVTLAIYLVAQLKGMGLIRASAHGGRGICTHKTRKCTYTVSEYSHM